MKTLKYLYKQYHYYQLLLSHVYCHAALLKYQGTIWAPSLSINWKISTSQSMSNILQHPYFDFTPIIVNRQS